MAFLVLTPNAAASLVGRVDDGEVVVQCLNGPGLWLGKSAQSLTSPRESVLRLYDGFFVDAAQGIVTIRWSGDIFAIASDSVSNTYAQIDYGGCVDG